MKKNVLCHVVLENGDAQLMVWTGYLSRIAHEETNHSAVYFKAGSTDTYKIQIEQGY